MIFTNRRPLRHMLATTALVLLACTGNISQAQTTTCVPGASGALPVVNTGLPVVQI